MEEMRDVVGFENYFSITCDGRFWSKRTNKFLKQYLHENGYYVISTKIGGRKGKSHLIRVHRAVAMAFVDGLSDERNVVNHIDCNKTNNHFSNLEWVTHKENTLHAIENGCMDESRLKSRKLSAMNRKLSDEDVLYIRNNYVPRDKNFGARSFSRKFNVSHVVVLDVIHLRDYKRTLEEVLNE